MYDVLDGKRHLRFEGVRLAASTSQSRGRTRWVEFELYRTTGKQYVLARKGVSLYYHSADCPVVARNKISSEIFSTDVLSSGLVACEDCSPIFHDGDDFYPETARYWAQVNDTADAVVNSLYKYDDLGARYLTNVARKLLSDAAEIDDSVYEAFYNELVE